MTRLDHIPVDLKAHAKSWLPGSQFAVVAHPQPQLVRLAPEPPSQGPEFATWMLAAKGQLQGPELGHRHPRPVLEGQGATALPAESAAWWGTGKLIEFCSYLPDLSVLYQLVGSVRRRRLPLVRHRRHRRPLCVLLGDRARARPRPDRHHQAHQPA
ncbi:putative protein OS=Streptomyces glaucescens OX=1907 GN=SGLAU_21530 PE=4 SV=1 [Streptomyces glaucescens]